MRRLFELRPDKARNWWLGKNFSPSLVLEDPNNSRISAQFEMEVDPIVELAEIPEPIIELV